MLSESSCASAVCSSVPDSSAERYCCASSLSSTVSNFLVCTVWDLAAVEFSAVCACFTESVPVSFAPAAVFVLRLLASSVMVFLLCAAEFCPLLNP